MKRFTQGIAAVILSCGVLSLLLWSNFAASNNSETETTETTETTMPLPWAPIHSLDDDNIVLPLADRMAVTDDKNDTIGTPQNGVKVKGRERDALCDNDKLGYSTDEVNRKVFKLFEGKIDLHGKLDAISLAVLADDEAIVKIYDYEDDAPHHNETPLETFRVAGGALWKPASFFAESSFILMPERRYWVTVEYKNKHHWEDTDRDENGNLVRVDADGVSLYQYKTEIPLTIDLQIANVDDDEEEDPGIFIPINDDFDEGHTNSSNEPLPDHQVNTEILEDDNELIDGTLTITAPAETEGIWKIVNSSVKSNVIIWYKSEDGWKKIGPSDGSNESEEITIDGSGIRVVELKVEGIEFSETVQDITIEAFFTPADSELAAVTDLLNMTVAQVEITEVKGLYQEDGTYKAGYTSGDNDGRIYSNRIYDTNDPKKTIWTKNKQYVDFSVKVQPANLLGTTIAWTVSDPDDPTNEDPAITKEAKKILDPNDYNKKDDDNDGKTDKSDGNDNTGTRDHTSDWEKIHNDYALTGAETKIKNGISKVRFHATDDGGDNYIVKASLKLNGKVAKTGGAKTGVMTTWKRIFVQKAIMKDVPVAKRLDNSKIIERFKVTFTEIQFTAPTIDSKKIDPMGATYALARAAFIKYLQNNANGGHFTKEGKGVMFLVVAHEFESIPASLTEILFPRPSEIGDNANQCTHWGFTKFYISSGNDGAIRYAKITKSAATNKIILQIYKSKNPMTGVLVTKVAEGSIINAIGKQLLKFTEIANSGCNGSVVIDYTADDLEIKLTLHEKAEAILQPIPVAPKFQEYKCPYPLKDIGSIRPDTVLIHKNGTPGAPRFSTGAILSPLDNSKFLPTRLTYSLADPNTLERRDLLSHGFKINTKQFITVLSEGSSYESGRASSIEYPTDPKKLRFNGRCMIFSKNQGISDLIGTVAHEFTHCLGIAHNCGYKGCKGNKTCPMTYYNRFLKKSDGTLIPWSNGNLGEILCAPHVKIIRETNLEKEGPGLKLNW